ncbi:MAG: phenylalanine--tRNA ligase subunit beta [Bryobacteraceae bacterium]
MKFSYNWISELVDQLDLAPVDLERLITMKTAECEGIGLAGEILRYACAARVKRVEPIEGSHNQVAVVETEQYGPKTVVCGAPNCRIGLRTVYVPLAAKVIAGVESDGMLASGAELGLNREAEGLVELVDAPFTLKPDSIIEIDNKSITHRPDLWGHLGMAREVAAFSGRRLKDPARMGLLPSGPGTVGVSIEDFDLCPRYSALVFENVTVKPSPLWLQYRLEAIGLNPINNIVDFTNYIMAELGQPTHAFDRAKLQGETIYVRRARAGERIVALNDEEYALAESNVVIADAGGPVAIGGVIGGRDTAIDDATTSIVLESANFHPSNIRKTSALLKLRTDASMRFEKAQDPENTTRALARAMELLIEVSPGIRVVGGVSDSRRAPSVPAPIVLPLDWLERKLGRSLAREEVVRILTSLDFGVTVNGNALEVRVPSWRATKDISIKDDLVEEIGRMVGYGTIVPGPPMVAAGAVPPNKARRFYRSLRAALTALGYTEVSNYSFVSEEQVAAFGWKPREHVEVANPIASDQTLMRKSLWPGIRKNLIDNSRHLDGFRIFEIGREIHKQAAGLPRENTRLVASVYAKDNGVAGLFALKRAAEVLLPGAATVPGAAMAHEHPRRSATVVWRGETVGRMFEFHPDLLEGRGAVLDLDLDAVQAAPTPEMKCQPLRRFPSSEFDLSVLAALREHAGDLESKLASLVPREFAEGIVYVREYAGAPLPEGQKSVSFRVTVGSRERTLSSEEVGTIRQGIIDGMRSQGYDLRV